MPDIINLWSKATQENPNLKSKEILNNTTKDIKYGLKQTKINKSCEIRILPKNSSFFFKDTNSAIFEDKLMLVSLKNKLFTTLIQSEIIANSMRALYYLAWQSAIPLKKFIEDRRIK